MTWSQDKKYNLFLKKVVTVKVLFLLNE